MIIKTYKTKNGEEVVMTLKGDRIIMTHSIYMTGTDATQAINLKHFAELFLDDLHEAGCIEKDEIIKAKK